VTITYYHNDLLGSPVAATDEQGKVIWRKSYAPYGELLNQNVTDDDIGFTGHKQDKEIGLTYAGARYYDQQIGRFTGIDSVGVLGSVESNPMMFNRYTYANNNPYKYVDPDGRELQKVNLIGGDRNNTIQIRTYLFDKTIAADAKNFVSQANKAFPAITMNNAFRIKSSQDIATTNTKSKVSRHQGGFALDLNGVGSLNTEQRSRLDTIAAEHGFSPAIDRDADLPHYSSNPTENGYKSLDAAIKENKSDYNLNHKGEVGNLYE